MRGEIAEEHRRLDVLFEEARAALEAGPGEAAHHALVILAEALEAHFEREDRLYYPAVGALRREHASLLRSFATGHTRFLGQIDAIARRLAEGAFAGAASELEALAAEFAAHEGQEEELLRAIEGEIAAAR
jgi:hypothetical protein